MNENFTTPELLIRYLDGELDEAQSADIKNKLDQDPAVQKELENLRIAKAAIKDYGLKNKVALIHKEMMMELKEVTTSSSPAPIRQMLQYVLRIAAIVIFVTGAFIAYQYFSATPEKLFSENFSGFTIHETRGTALSPLKEAYQKNNMLQVIEQFKLLQQPEPEDCFFAGNAYLSSLQPAKAIDAFIALQQKNKTNNTHYYAEDADYYLALGYLANNEPVKAIPIFEKINTDVNHPYHKKVSNWLLSKLHRISAVK